MALGAAATRRHPTWFFYSVAAALGVAFSAVLLLLAWNNAVQNAVRAFAFESISIDELASKQVRAADDTLRATISFLKATHGSVGYAEFQAFCSDAITGQSFIRWAGWYETFRQAPAALHLHVACSANGDQKIPTNLELGDPSSAPDLRTALETDSNVPIAFAGDLLADSEYALARRLQTSSAATETTGIVIFIIDSAELLGRQKFDDALGLSLLLESEGLGGRRRLFEKPKSLPDSAVIRTLTEQKQVRFERYSFRIESVRDLAWRDLDKALIFTALLLSTGVTLLLIALARARELQTRELTARNRVIEQQVHRQTRELAVARDEALTASKVKSDFLASMSHEIRTPLNAIIGMAELLSDTALSTEQNRYVGVFKNAGEALLSLVNDILDLSKIEAGQLVLEEIPFEPRELLEQAADIYGVKTASKGLELAVNVNAAVPAWVIGDPSRLRQVVLNLVGNAIKFTERGEIVVAAEIIVNAASTLRLRCTVTDTGIGIPADKIEAIFGSFTQVDSSTTRKYGGTGLGLAISKRLVELMGGRIGVVSTVGEGSTFSFEIDLKPAQAQVSSPVPAPNLAGKAVLVIDDNATNRLILAQTLVTVGARVFEAQNGKDAVRVFQARKTTHTAFDLILCDSQMPEMDGFTAIESMQALGADPSTILMLTSSNLGHDVEHARRLALGGFLVKPIKRKELYSALAKMLTHDAVRTTTPASGARENAKRWSILLVEDNPDNRLLIRAYLKNEAFDIEEAGNGAEAVLQVQAREFDLILMDVQMPVMDGHTATRKIRQHELECGRPAIPVIALTAHAVKEEVDKSLDAGCNAHLAKPIKKQTLLTALAEHLH